MDVRPLLQQLTRPIGRVVVDEQEAVDAEALVVREEERESIGLVVHGGATDDLGGCDRELAVVDACEAVAVERSIHTTTCEQEGHDAFVGHATREVVARIVLDLVGVRPECVVEEPRFPESITSREVLRDEGAERGYRGSVIHQYSPS